LHEFSLVEEVVTRIRQEVEREPTRQIYLVELTVPKRYGFEPNVLKQAFSLFTRGRGKQWNNTEFRIMETDSGEIRCRALKE